MFTGIVEIIGTVSKISPLDPAHPDDGIAMVISDSAEILGDTKEGDSISVNGTCLTVTEPPHPTSFRVGIAPESLRRTNLGALRVGSKVNLERAMLPTTRVGGHLVQGHVDATASILSRTPDGTALTLRFAPSDKAVLRYIVEKGFITVDGASLTVTAVGDSWWEVMLVEYTQSRIVTAAKEVGEEVNVEVDQVGKYVEKSIAAWTSEAGVAGSTSVGQVLERLVAKLVDDRLKNKGVA